MKARFKLLLAALPVAVVFSGDVRSKQLGIFPNTSVGFPPINVGSLTRDASKSCGQCHLNGQGNVTVAVTPTNRSIVAGQSTAITVSGTSSNGTTHGGFCADVTAGTLVAGTNSQINTAGNAITHVNRISRSWSFNWKAPTSPGLAEFYTVVNCADGSNPPDTNGDRWAFHGNDPNASLSTPVRLYANASSGVTPTGNGCSDGFGNVSVLGAPDAPTVGNGNFKIEGFGMPPSAPLLIMLSFVQTGVPGFEMSALGAPSCFLHTALQLQVQTFTGSGNATRAEGSFSLPLPIPSNIPKGLRFQVQYGYLDNNSKRPFPFTTSNGLDITVQ